MPWWAWLLTGMACSPVLIIVCGAIWDTFLELRDEKKWRK